MRAYTCFLCRGNVIHGVKWRVFAPLMLFFLWPCDSLPGSFTKEFRHTSFSFGFRSSRCSRKAPETGSQTTLALWAADCLAHCESSYAGYSSVIGKWLSYWFMLWSWYVIFSLLIVSLVNFRSLYMQVVGAVGVTFLHSPAICLGYRGLKLYLMLCLSCVYGGWDVCALFCLIYSNDTLLVTFSSRFISSSSPGGRQCTRKPPSEVA